MFTLAINVVASIIFLLTGRVDVCLYSWVFITLAWEVLILARYFLRDKEREACVHEGGYKTFGPMVGTAGFLLVFSQFLMFRKVEDWGHLVDEDHTVFALVLAGVFTTLNLVRVRRHRCVDLLWSSLSTIWLVVPLAIASTNFLTMTIPVVFLAGNQGPDHFNPFHLKGGTTTLRVLEHFHFGLSLVYLVVAIASTVV